MARPPTSLIALPQTIIKKGKAGNGRMRMMIGRILIVGFKYHFKTVKQLSEFGFVFYNQ